jgi:uncharacterized membrane protein YkvA (DUF1232 family)
LFGISTFHLYNLSMKRFSIGRKGLSLNIFRIIYYFPHFLKLYWRLFRDKRVPLYLKAMLVTAVIYFISPVDLIPELLNPFIGFVDDIVVISLAMKGFIKLAPKDVVAEHVRAIQEKR